LGSKGGGEGDMKLQLHKDHKFVILEKFTKIDTLQFQYLVLLHNSKTKKHEGYIIHDYFNPNVDYSSSILQLREKNKIIIFEGHRMRPASEEQIKFAKRVIERANEIEQQLTEEQI
jgi:hypothetical protein